MSKKIIELKRVSLEDSVAQEFIRRFNNDCLELEKRLWIPVIETNSFFQTLKNKTNQEMKTLKVISKKPEQEFVYAEDCKKESVYLYDHSSCVIGIILSFENGVIVQWANGNKSEKYLNRFYLIKDCEKNKNISIHQVTLS